MGHSCLPVRRRADDDGAMQPQQRQRVCRKEQAGFGQNLQIGEVHVLEVGKPRCTGNPYMKDRYGIAQNPIAWFEKQTDLPFLKDKGSLSVIWISEIMAQQTRIAALIPYFERFTKQFPTVEALAAAEEEEVLKGMAGFRILCRARNLQGRAEDGGGMRRKGAGEPEQLRKMPGIGAYTAGAVLSIAYGQRPAVDGNATGFARIEEIYEDVLKPQTIRQITDIIRDMMPDGQAGRLLRRLWSWAL